jgi:hypothetical protein
VITDGRANHAGAGAWPWIDDGNGELVGLELENDGLGEPWTPGLMAIAVKVAARLCTVLGVELVLGHKEWAPGRKPDPSFDMHAFRTAVTALRIPPPNLEELLMATSAFQLIGDQGLVVTFVPGQRSISMGGLGAVHGALNSSGVAPVAGTIAQGELEAFAQRWNESVA